MKSGADRTRVVGKQSIDGKRKHPPHHDNIIVQHLAYLEAQATAASFRCNQQ